MEPTIPRGGRIRIADERMSVGDVALFEAGDHFISHRILARIPTPVGTFLVHKGDAEPGAPGLVRKARVIGRVLTPRRSIPLATRLSAAAAALLRAARQRLGRPEML